MKQTILVIDDNTELRENTAEILELAGFQTITAENGKKGVELAIRDKPAIIICDIMMPELDGYGVLHMIRRNPETMHIPFIFLTAKTDRTDFRKGMEMGADDYITKPFDDLELLNAVEIRFKKLDILEEKYPESEKGLTQFLTDVKNAGLPERLSDQYASDRFEKKHAVYLEGKRPRFLYYVVKGRIKCFKMHEDGKEYITSLHTSGDFLGYTALIEDSLYEESAEALEESEIISIPKDEFLHLIYTDVSIAAKFIHIISKNVKEKEDRLLALAYSSLRKRVAAALLDIVNRFNPGEIKMPIEISREEIAQYVGTATESLIRTLSDFKAEKRIDIKNGKITVSHPDQLKNMKY